MSGKVITNLSEIEAIRAVENKKVRRVQAKMSEFQYPGDPSLTENPEIALPPAPKRRGRPPKHSTSPLLLAAPVSPQQSSN